MTVDEVDFLEHFGVKGMKWGVVKKYEPVGDKVSPALKTKLTASTKPLTPDQKKRLKESEAKHDAHFDKSEDEGPKGWRPTGKQVAVAAAGAVVVAGILYKVKTGNADKPFSAEDYMKVARSAETPGWLSSYAGKSMSPNDYKGIAQNSAGRVWTGNYITKDLFDQPEQKFQAGHEFFRVTHGVETSFKATTFATASKDDAARYFLGWKENTTNMVSFKAKEEIKVPNLHTSLEAMRTVMVRQGEKVSPEKVVEHFTNNSGGDWSTGRGAKVVEVLKGWGYHGIVDHMDAGVYGENPLVLFEPSKFTDKVTTLRENVDVAGLTSILKDVSNRR